MTLCSIIHLRASVETDSKSPFFIQESTFIELAFWFIVLSDRIQTGSTLTNFIKKNHS
jgi:hypothetical protein